MVIFLTLWPFHNQRKTQERISHTNDKKREREKGSTRKEFIVHIECDKSQYLGDRCSSRYSLFYTRNIFVVHKVSNKSISALFKKVSLKMSELHNWQDCYSTKNKIAYLLYRRYKFSVYNADCCPLHNRSIVKMVELSIYYIVPRMLTAEVKKAHDDTRQTAPFRGIKLTIVHYCK